MKRPDKRQILHIHEMLIDEFGGIHGIRDEGLLESALNVPFLSFGDVDFYPSIPEKAARLGFGLVKNHPFLDGNKRIGAHAMLLFLTLNQIPFLCDNAELETMFFSIADGSADYQTLLRWLNEHIT